MYMVLNQPANKTTEKQFLCTWLASVICRHIIILQTRFYIKQGKHDLLTTCSCRVTTSKIAQTNQTV